MCAVLHSGNVQKPFWHKLTPHANVPGGQLQSESFVHENAALTSAGRTERKKRGARISKGH